VLFALRRTLTVWCDPLDDRDEEYRRYATEAIEQSDLAKHPSDQASWLQIARKWLDLLPSANARRANSSTTTPGRAAPASVIPAARISLPQQVRSCTGRGGCRCALSP
jgi:hypothetical protein